MSNTDKDWEQLGKTDPYFAVLTKKEYHQENLDNNSVAKFFDSGHEHIQFVLSTVMTYVDASFRAQRALDFGCGVGRLLVPLAAACTSVVGIDISTSMLSEAKRNLDARNISNVSLVQSDDALSQLTEKFDLIHSHIVFQHIPTSRGEQIFEKLLDLLQKDGIGIIQVPYLCKHSLANRVWYWIRKSIPLMNGVGNLRRKLPFNQPMIQMNEYNLNRLLQILQDKNCRLSYIHCVKEPGSKMDVYNATLFFQKST